MDRILRAIAILIFLHLVASVARTEASGFIENRGQSDGRVAYYACGHGRSVFFTPDGIVLELREETTDGGGAPAASRDPRAPFAARRTWRRWAIHVSFPEECPAPLIEARGVLPTRHHFFRGADAANWRIGVREFSEIVYRELWPGVDLVFRCSDLGVVYEAIPAAGFDADVVRFRYHGVEEIVAQDEGSFLLVTPLGSIEDAGARLGEGPRVLRWPGTPPALAPITADDPSTLLWSTYLGGIGGEHSGLALHHDTLGNLLITGGTDSADFPATPGSQDPTHNGFLDAFVAKLDKSGSALLWASYLGGTSSESAFGLAVDASGNVFIAGRTYSLDFPTTPGAFDQVRNGDEDAFVAKLNPAGSSLLWSTLLGGSETITPFDAEVGFALALDPQGRPTVAGFTANEDFPTTPGAFDEEFNFGPTWAGDAFVTKFHPSGGNLVWSTFVGGTHDDVPYALVFDAGTNPIIAGYTESSDYPTTTGAYDPTHNGAADGFVTKLHTSGSFLLWSTVIGGAEPEELNGLALDAEENAVIAGDTYSSDFPTTPGAYDETFNGAALTSDAYVAKIAASGSSLQWSTFLGSSSHERCRTLALHPDGSPLVAGSTQSAGFPTTAGAYDGSYNGTGDMFLSRLNPTGASLAWSTFFGGSGFEEPYAVVLDRWGVPAFSGQSYSPDLPTTPGAYDPVFGGGGNYDVFVAKLTGMRTGVPPGTLTPSPLLARPFPNPSTGRVAFTPDLDPSGVTRITILDLDGRLVFEGAHVAPTWDGRDNHGNAVGPGVYLYQLEAGGHSTSGKLVIAR